MGPGLVPRPVAAAIGIVVTLVWGVAQLAGIASRAGLLPGGYEPPEQIHLALLAVLTSLGIVTRRGGEGGDPDPDSAVEQDEPSRRARTYRDAGEDAPVTAAQVIARVKRERDAQRP